MQWRIKMKVLPVNLLKEKVISIGVLLKRPSHCRNFLFLKNGLSTAFNILSRVIANLFQILLFTSTNCYYQLSHNLQNRITSYNIIF